MDDLKNFCCVNKNCSKHGLRGEDNIRVRDWYGKNNDIRLLYCLVCKKRFSERQGTPLFDSRLPKEQVVSIGEHLVEGNGLRKTGRLTGADYRTAGRYDSPQDAGKRACDENRLSNGVRHGRTGQGRPCSIEVQPKSEHVLYRTTKWYGQQPLQSEDSQVVLFFEGLGRSSSGDVFDDVQLQFLLVGPDVTPSGWPTGSVQSGNVGRTRRSCLDDP